MKCPMSFTYKKIGGLLFSNATSNCLKEECAWWDIISERCAVKELAVQLRSLNAILVKMGQNLTLR